MIWGGNKKRERGGGVEREQGREGGRRGEWKGERGREREEREQSDQPNDTVLLTPKSSVQTSPELCYAQPRLIFSDNEPRSILCSV